MNFLELCKATALDAGTIAGLPSFTTTAGASGRVAQLVGWVRDAWIDIQNERQDWLWMRKLFIANLTIGEETYAPTDLGITDFGSFVRDTPEQRNIRLHDPAIGYKDERAIEEIPYSRYHRMFDTGYTDPNRPEYWSFSPQGNFVVGATPDKAYSIRGEYRRTPQVLTLDGDVPEMPVAYHRLIQAEAIRLMARSDEAFQVVVEKTESYMRLRSPLVREQTPRVSIAEEPLA